VGCGGTTQTSTASLSTGVWAHVTWVFDSTNKSTIYINGSLDQGPTDISGGQTLGTGNDLIGVRYVSGALSDYFTGSLSTFQLYNRALTTQEVKQNCLAQQGRFGVSSCAAP
jgi:hypothetical protein